MTLLVQAKHPVGGALLHVCCEGIAQDDLLGACVRLIGCADFTVEHEGRVYPVRSWRLPVTCISNVMELGDEIEARLSEQPTNGGA